jgi:hypothetical protein
MPGSTSPGSAASRSTRRRPGRSRASGNQGAYGNLITLNHGFGLETRYGHLLDYSVKSGSQVKRGDIIGHVGATAAPPGTTCTTRCSPTASFSTRSSSSRSKSLEIVRQPPCWRTPDGGRPAVARYTIR